MADRSPARVVWAEGEAAEIQSAEELDTLLDALHAQAASEPFIAEVVLASGESLSVGLGSERTVLNWVSSTGEPPYFGSQGDPNATGVVVFRYFGSLSEFPGTSAIPVETGRRAVREFLVAGHRPETFAWAEE
jgi:hypothetical protein